RPTPWRRSRRRSRTRERPPDMAFVPSSLRGGRVGATAALLLVAATALTAADTADPGGWSRFRGPNGSGISTSTRLPTEFGPARNVVWKTALPVGHSSPALTRDPIFLTAPPAHRLVTIRLHRPAGCVLAEPP